MVITLIGYRGVGKSHVGEQLAHQLGLSFVDADAEIERQSDRSITQIFQESGEKEFRRLEKLVLKELLKQPHRVIASGGGAILCEETRNRMRASGPVVWLQATAETIWERISTDLESASVRPHLTQASPRDEVDQLLAARTPLYAQTASLIIETDDRSIAEIVHEIVTHISANSN